MRFDVTLGSGWSFGGPWITEEPARGSVLGDARGRADAARDQAVRMAGDRSSPRSSLTAARREPTRAYVAVPMVDGVAQVPSGLGPAMRSSRTAV